MSTHSEPRRWRLGYRPPLTDDEAIWVREDKVTTADRESVVAWLIENYEAAAEGPRSVLEVEADDLLARIFEEQA